MRWETETGREGKEKVKRRVCSSIADDRNLFCDKDFLHFIYYEGICVNLSMPKINSAHNFKSAHELGYKI